MLIGTALMITLSFLLSSAQSQAPPSPECIAAYNATFSNEATGSCEMAYFALIGESATDDQRMMVCNSDQQCNTMLESIISACGNTIFNPTRLSLDLLCVTGPNGANCLTTFNMGLGVNASEVFNRLGADCTGPCNQGCMQVLMQLNNSLGCCLVETLQSFVRSGFISNHFASLVANGHPLQCGIDVFRSCDGDDILLDECSNATAYLFGPNDLCSRSVREVFINGSNSAAFALFSGDCPGRFSAYVNYCNQIFLDEDSNDIMRLANGTVALSQSTSRSGRNCSELLPMFLSAEFEDLNDVTCAQDYFLDQCSTGCRNRLTSLIDDFDCCLNVVPAFFIGTRNQVEEQIEYAIITREIYSICGIDSPGFCEGVTQPAYTAAAETCVDVRNSIHGTDDDCLNNLLALIQRTSADAVDNAATAVCTSQRCRDRISSYVDFLITCQLDNVLDDDVPDGNEVDTGYLDFAYLTGNTTCRVGSDNTSCYTLAFYNPQFDLISTAFETGVCVSDPSAPCSDECMAVMSTAYNSVGCCLGEYTRVLLGDDLSASVASRCNLAMLNNRCSEIAVIPVGGGAGTQRGLGIIAISLLGVIAFMLS